jgi:hypothetical protein
MQPWSYENQAFQEKLLICVIHSLRCVSWSGGVNYSFIVEPNRVDYKHRYTIFPDSMTRKPETAIGSGENFVVAYLVKRIVFVATPLKAIFFTGFFVHGTVKRIARVLCPGAGDLGAVA